MSYKLSIPSQLRAACAVCSVAIGDRLGLDMETLRRLRACVEESEFSGSEDLDAILRFVSGLAVSRELGVYPVPEAIASASVDDPVVRSYCEVARLVQPLSLPDPPGRRGYA